MAANAQNTPEIARLIQASAAARAQLGRELTVFRQRLDGPAKVIQSLRQHPFRWLGGALGTGFVASLLFRRNPPADRKSRGIRGLLWGLAATAVRPAVKTWLTGHFKQLLADRLHPKSQPPAFSPNSSFPTRP